MKKIVSIFLIISTVILFGFEIKTDNLTIDFNKAGNFAKIILDNQRTINVNPQAQTGFWAVIQNKEGKQLSTQLKIDSYKNNILKLSSPYVVIDLNVKNKKDYVTFEIVKIQDVGDNQIVDFIFNPNNNTISIYPLDWVSAWENGIIKVHGLFARKPNAPMGKFVVFYGKDDVTHDEILLDIWVNEGLPHPKINEQWTKKRAKEWLDDWQSKFSDQSAMIIQPNNNDELYVLTDYAKKIGMTKIYLHTDVWRGEYWPVNNSFLHINRKNFPNGIADFKKYSNYLKANNLDIGLHIVSCSIGRHDPYYVKNKIDDNLAAWVTGSLAKPINANSTEIYLQVPQGTIYPEKSQFGWKSEINKLRSFMDNSVIQIGNELVRVGKFENTNTNVWVLKNCQRGLFNTKAVNHAKANKVKGLFMPYRQVFVADVDSMLLDKIITRYTTFCKENSVTHIECDGAEIYDTVPWGRQKFLWKMYENLSHPTTSNTSNARPMTYHIEYWFKSSKKVENNRPHAGIAGGNGIPLILEKKDRLTTNPYEMLLKPTENLKNDYGKSFNLISPIPMFGISTYVLKNYGLLPELEEMITLYRQAGNLLDSTQRAEIRKQFGPYPSPFNEARNHIATKVLYRPILKGDKLILEHLRLIGTQDNEMPMGWGQEFGPLVPWQFTEINKPFELNNPYNAQELEFLVRVMPQLVEADKENTVDSSSTTKSDKVLESYQTGAGHDVAVNPLAKSKHIWDKNKMTKNVADAGKIYIRKEFNVDSPNEYSELNLIFQVDDSAKIYFNENEIFSGGAFDKALIVSLLKYIRHGKNVLAIEVDNHSGPGAFVGTIESINKKFVKRSFHSDKTWITNSKSLKWWNHVNYNSTNWTSALELANYGKGEWPEVTPIVALTSVSLMPKDTKVISLEKSNNSTNILRNDSGAKVYSVNANMAQARGIALTVNGDNSNSILQVRIFGRNYSRDYIVPINFSGEREVIIPSGEVSWSNENWGWRWASAHMSYDNVDKIMVNLNSIKPNTMAKISMKNMRIMQEKIITLTNPTIKTSAGSLKVLGEVSSNQYIHYTGGDTVVIYNANYYKIKELKVEKNSFIIPKGKTLVAISSDNKNLKNLWLQSLYVVKGDAIELKELDEKL